MSHSIDFYIKEEGSEEKPKFMFSFGGCTEIYSRFRDNGGFSSTLQKEFCLLSKELMDDIEVDLKKDIKHCTDFIEEVRKLNNANIEVVNESMSKMQYLDDLNDCLDTFNFLMKLKNLCEWSDNKILYNSY